MTQVRLYGPVVGNGSFCRVTEGIRGALAELGLLAGLVPIDAYDDEAVYGGATAPIALFIGPMGHAGIMQTRGMHQERLVLVPPNSSYVPSSLLRHLEQGATGLVSPSHWGAGILRGLTSLPVEVAPHGIDPQAFHRFSGDEDRQDQLYKLGDFRVVHLASTVAERKGTRELLRAWCRTKRAGELGRMALLTVAADGPPDAFQDLLLQEAGGGEPMGLIWISRLNCTATQMGRFLRTAHLIACPSRGEGFGLLPLEARACGLPVLVTGGCTGHTEHCPNGEEAYRWGVVDVPVGDLAPIDEAAGAMAPSLDVDDLCVGLMCAYRQWTDLARAARSASQEVRETWSWKAVTAAWWAKRTSSLDRRASPT